MKKPAGLGMLTRMDRSFRWFSLLLVSIALAACGTMRSSVVVEPTTNGGIEQFRVVRRGDEHGVHRPLFEFLEQHVYDSLQFPEFGGIVAPFGDRIELIEEQNTRSAPGVVEYSPQVKAGLSEEA